MRDKQDLTELIDKEQKRRKERKEEEKRMVKTEGKPRVVEERHLGGFATRIELYQKDGDFGINFKANSYKGESPTQEQLEELARKETGCENVEVHAVDVFFGFREIRHNCTKGK